MSKWAINLLMVGFFIFLLSVSILILRMGG